MKNHPPVVQKFSKHLRSLRKKYNLTQEELSEKSNISYKNIQYLEAQDPSCPTLITLNKLAKAFDISLSELMKF